MRDTRRRERERSNGKGGGQIIGEAEEKRGKVRSNKVLERYDFNEGYVLVNLLCCFILIFV